MHREKEKETAFIDTRICCYVMFCSKRSECNFCEEKLAYQTTWKISEAFSMHIQNCACFPPCSLERWRQTSRLWVSYWLLQCTDFSKSILCLSLQPNVTVTMYIYIWGLWNINSKGDWSDSLNYRGYPYQANVEDLRKWNAKHEREILKKLESNLERSQTKDNAEFYLGK